MERHFIRRLLAGSIILLFICVILFSSVVWYVREHYALKFDSSILVLGNSHPECAIDDEKFPVIKNLARSAEPLYYTKYKLQWILKWNPQISTVFVELSENQLESRMKEWIWSDENRPRQSVALFPYLTWDHHLRALQKRHVFYLQDMFLSVRRIINGIFFERQVDFFKQLDWGGFEKQEGSRNKEDQNIAGKGPQEKLNPDADNLKALFEINEMGRKAGVKIVFMRCPYRRDAPLHFEESYHQFLQNHSELMFMDFKDAVLEEDCFFDEQHLNRKGAELFTKEFVKVMGL